MCRNRVFLFSALFSALFSGCDLVDFPPNTGGGGNDDTDNVSTFPRADHAKADILFTIDNSCSMADEQGELGAHAATLIDILDNAGIDYHIGSTTADDGDDGELTPTIGGERFVTPFSPLPTDQVADLVDLGTAGSGSERGLGTTYRALELQHPFVNSGFRRDDASIVVVVMSDEADQTAASLITTNEFVGWYDALKADPNQRRFSAIVDPVVGTDYIQVTNAIGGLVHDISDFGYGAFVDAVAHDVVASTNVYCLDGAANAASIIVEIEDVMGNLTLVDGTNWSYNDVSDCVTLLGESPAIDATLIVSWDNA